MISVAQQEWIFPFTGLQPVQFRRLVRLVAERGGDVIADGRPGRQWSLDLADRVLLVAVYWRTNLTMRQIGLLFVNYELVLRGYKTIYLGQTIPLESLVDLKKYYDDPIFVSYFTVIPTKDDLGGYFKDFQEKLHAELPSKLWVLGRMTQFVSEENLPPNVALYHSIEQLLEKL